MTPTGVVFEQSKDVKFDDLKLAIGQMGRLTRSAQFCLGDLINYAGKKYGSTYDSWIEMTGLSIGTLTNIAQVARNIPMSLRQENLDFSHHMVIAQSVKTEAQRKVWIEEAARQRLSVRELTASIKHGRVMRNEEILKNTTQRSSHKDDRGTEPHSVTLAKLTRWTESAESEHGPVEEWDEMVRIQLQQEFRALHEFVTRLFNEN